MENSWTAENSSHVIDNYRLKIESIEDERRAYLRHRGWQYTSELGAIWLWKREFDGRWLYVNESTALWLQERYEDAGLSISIDSGK